MKPRAPLALVGCALAAVALACASSPKSPPGRKRTVLLSSSYDDVRVGKESAEQVKAQTGLYDDPSIDAYVDRGFQAWLTSYQR